MKTSTDLEERGEGVACQSALPYLSQSTNTGIEYRGNPHGPSQNAGGAGPSGVNELRPILVKPGYSRTGGVLECSC